ncbi:MAG: translocation/assembly module TamB domain-containing protein [Acidobacteriota bacterium]
MKRDWRAKVLLALTLFVFLTVVLGIGFLHTGPGRKRVLSWLQDYLFANQGIRLDTEEIRYNLFDLAVSLREARLTSRASPDLPPILTADRMYVDLSLMSLVLRGFLQIEEARIDSPEVRIVILKDGRRNIPVSPRDVEEKSGGLPDFLVKSLRLGNGSFLFRDDRTGLQARLGNWRMRIDGAWSTLNHEIKLDADGLVEQKDREIPSSHISLQAAVPSNLEKVVVHHLGVTNPTASIQVQGTVDDLGKPNLGLKVSAHGDLARASALAGVSPPVAGRVEWDGEVRNTLDTLEVSGRVTGQNVSFRALEQVSFSSRVLWDMAQKRLMLSDLSVRSPEAELRGQASLSTEGAGQNTVFLNASRLDLGGLMRGLDIGVRIASQVRGRVEAAWALDDLDAADVRADFQLAGTSRQASRDTLPLSGSVVVRKEGGQAYVRLSEAETIGAALNADIRVSSLSNLGQKPSGRVSGRVSVQIADLLRLTTGLARFLGQSGPLLGTEVSGPAQLNARLGGTLQQPTASAEVRAPSTKVGKLEDVSLELAANYRADRLDVDRGVVAWRDQELLVGGTVSRLQSSDPRLDLNARLDNGSIQSLFLALEKPPPVTGRFKLLAGAKGTVDNPEITAHLDASELGAYGEAFGALSAEATLQNRTLVSRLSLEKPGNQGRLDLDARYHLDNESYELKAQAPRFELTSLQLGDRVFAGVLSLTGAGRGTIADPAGRLQLNGRNLRYGEDVLGNIEAVVQAQNREATLRASAPRFNLALDGSVGVEEPHPVKFTARFQGTDFSVLPLPAKNVPEGHLQAEISGAGLLGELQDAEVTAKVQNLSMTTRGQTIRSQGPMTIGYANRRVSLDSVRLVSDPSSVELRGSIPIKPEAEPGAVTLAANLDLGNVSSLLAPESGIKATGRLTIQGDVKGSLEELAPDLDVRLDNGSVSAPQLRDPLSGISLAARIEQEHAAIETLQARAGKGVITARARVPYGMLPGDLPIRKGEGSAELEAGIRDFDLRSVAALPPDARGQVSVEIQAQSPRADLRAATGTVRFGELALDVKGLEIRQAEPTAITLADGRATISRLRLSGQGANLEASGAVQVVQPGNIDLRVQGQISPGLVELFTDKIQAEGETNLQLAAKGTLSKPVLDGSLELNQVQMQVEDPDVRIDGLRGRLRLNANRLGISQLTGDINGGQLQANGGLTYVPPGVRDASIEAKASDFFLEYPEGLRTGLSADLKLTSPEENRLLLSGRVAVHEGAYTRSVGIWTELLGQLQKEQEVQLVQEPAPEASNLALNIKLDTEQPIIFDNNLAKVEARADLRITGTPATPGVTGRVSLEEGGQIHLRERDYTVDRGSITFVNETRIEPVLDVSARTQVDEYEVTLQITGPADDLKAEFTSNPPLPEPDVIALLITGRRLQELRGQETEVAKEQALSILGGGVGRQLGAGLQEATGLSQVRIEPQLIATESDPGARLTVAEDITKRLQLIYSMNLVDSSDQIYIGEYDVTERFKTRLAHYTNARVSSAQPNENLYRFDFNHRLLLGGGPNTGEVRGSERPKPEIAKVSFTGHPVLPISVLADKFDVETGQEFDFFEVRKGLDRLREIYKDTNYLEARVRLDHEVQAGKVNITVEIEAGPRVDLTYQGAELPDSVKEEVIGVWVDGVFDPQRADDAIQHIRAYFVKQNYLQPKIRYEITRQGADEKRVLFEIEPGSHFQKVRYQFPGARQIQPEELEKLISRANLKTAVWTDPGRVQEHLTQFYGQRSFLEAEVRQITYELDPQAGIATVVIPVEEGKLYRLGGFTFNGNRVYSDSELANVLSVKAGEPYDVSRVRNSVQTIEAVYRRKGYTDVEVTHVPKPDTESGRIGLEFDIKENRQKVIREIVVQGEQETSEHLVRNQIELKEGDVLDPEKVAQSRISLYDTGAFALVEIDSEEIKPDPNPDDNQQSVRLSVAVREVKPFEFRYGGSYDTERGAGVVGDIINRNSLGKARVLGFRGRFDQRAREARAYFTQPSLLYLPLETTFSAYGTREIDREANFTTDKLGLSIRQEALLKDHYILSYGYRFERTRVFDIADTGDLSLNLPPLNLAPLSATLTRDTRDDILNATEGAFFSQAFEWAPALLGSDLRYVKYYGQFFRYVPLRRPTLIPWVGVEKPRLVYAGAIRVGLAQGLGGQKLIPSERFFAGGETTIRGFRRDALGPRNAIGEAAGGEAVLVMNHEIRFPLFGIFDGVGFLDMGNVYADVRDFAPFTVRGAYGLGLRVHTPYVLIRADYGLKFSRRPGESAGAFFVSIGQAF